MNRQKFGRKPGNKTRCGLNGKAPVSNEACRILATGEHTSFPFIIGAGKTTLATKLAEKMNLPCFYEPVIDNVYLTDFYREPARYSFPLQVSHLKQLNCSAICCVCIFSSPSQFNTLLCLQCVYLGCFVIDYFTTLASNPGMLCDWKAMTTLLRQSCILLASFPGSPGCLVSSLTWPWCNRVYRCFHDRRVKDANDTQSDNRKFRSRLLVGKNCTTLYGDGCWTLVW